ncbi:hypothetical protein Riv7116_2167 [Rivularia sp. PCC 7116]|uniref:hypothetical protein n=1 Tax=Rivularia sp. PCC 7116 TaxID=373994 RepID=UPI00029F3151|nr:hypothetical protein [Rivularia sp. PCC 7116]AFY54695.1 hypothetical protein Riv7116_2167 [Rivularia sp. PCC 7116]
MLEIISILTFIWLAFWALLALRSLASGRFQSILVVILVHFIFAGIPLLLNFLIGQPDYNRFPGFKLASQDELTSIIYCIYISIIPLFWWFLGRNKKIGKIYNLSNKFSFLRKFKFILFLLLISPILVLAFAPAPEEYLIYGVVATGRLVDDVKNFHAYISLFSVLSLIGGVGLLASQPKIKLPSFILIFFCLLIAIWLNGKRNIVALSIFLIGYIFWNKGYLRGTKLIISVAIAIIFFFGYSTVYQSSVRGIGASLISPEIVYENFRIDYGRDHTIKTTIFAELYPDEIKILNYPGESILFYLTMYIPRDLWDEKPLPYAQYFTSAVFRSSPKFWGWSFTTSILEEAIANFGWYGMIIGPTILLMICRLGDRCRNGLISALTSLISSLFLAVHLVAFAPLFFLWCLVIIINRRNHPKKKRKLLV